MKKYFLSAAFAMLLGASTLIASEISAVDPQVLSAFKTQFENATEVEWTTGSNYYKADFSYNNNYVSAYYNTEGELIATVRNIASVNLPIMLQTSLKNNYEGYWISDLYELTKDEGITYIITLENADQKMVLKSAGGYEWSLTKKTSKV